MAAKHLAASGGSVARFRSLKTRFFALDWLQSRLNFDVGTRIQMLPSESLCLWCWPQASKDWLDVRPSFFNASSFVKMCWSINCPMAGQSWNVRPSFFIAAKTWSWGRTILFSIILATSRRIWPKIGFNVFPCHDSCGAEPASVPGMILSGADRQGASQTSSPSRSVEWKYCFCNFLASPSWPRPSKSEKTACQRTWNKHKVHCLEMRQICSSHGRSVECKGSQWGRQIQRGLGKWHPWHGPNLSAAWTWVPVCDGLPQCLNAYLHATEEYGVVAHLCLKLALCSTVWCPCGCMPCHFPCWQAQSKVERTSCGTRKCSNLSGQTNFWH